MKFFKRDINFGGMKTRLCTGTIFRQAIDEKSSEPIIDEEQRAISFIASQQTEDRMGDVVGIHGMNIDDYNRNPVLMPFHEYNRAPIGRVFPLTKDLSVVGKSSGDESSDTLNGVAIFSKNPHNHTAIELWGEFMEGNMKGFSVGFVEVKSLLRVKETADDPDNVAMRLPGVFFDKSILLEISAAPVPAHGSALVEEAMDTYQAKSHAEAIVGHSLGILDKDNAAKVVECFVSTLEKAFADVSGAELPTPVNNAIAIENEPVERTVEKKVQERPVLTNVDFKELAEECIEHTYAKFGGRL